MLLSLNWLNEYVDLEGLKPETIAQTLTDLGLEVEAINHHDALHSDIVVGRILEANPHPNADSLKVCSVDVGKDEALTIVCGAPNARAGIQVCVAQVGVCLPGDFKIKKAKIRGQASFGMLCSEKEIGASEENDGIMELEASLAVGSPINDLYNFADTVLELGITPNRGDCLSYFGIARDLAAKLQKTLKTPPVYQADEDTLASSDFVNVKVSHDAGCGRFTALYIEGVTHVDAPFWMRRRLELSGIRPINLIVDISNYCMLETGQPMHAYDAKSLAKQELQVRPALINDELVTLDGQKAQLKPGDLLICDGEKPVGLAGVMGGANSEISSDTSSLVLEVAHFSSVCVRKTAKRLGLSTEASHRFERGIDIDQLATVAFRFANLLRSTYSQLGIEDIKVASSLVDYYPKPIAKKRIAVRLPRVKQMLDLPAIRQETCIKHLESIEFKLLDKTSDRMLFEVPSFRNDIDREIDLIEEIARLEGFDKIPLRIPKMEIVPNVEDPFIEFADLVKYAAANQGLCEIITFPFLSLADYGKLNLNERHPLWPNVRLQNALNEEMSFMQTSLIPGLLQAISKNRSHGIKGSRLFEMGRTYFSSENCDFEQGRHIQGKARQESGRVIERTMLAGSLDFPIQGQEWNRKEESPSFFNGKALLQSICEAFSVRDLQWQRPKADELPWLNPGASATVFYNDTCIGWVGELHPRVALDSGLGTVIPVLFEIDMEQLFDSSQAPLEIEPQGRKFPPALRDFAFVLPNEVSYEKFKLTIKKFPRKKYLKSWALFDLYTGENLPSGKKSLAATFKFESSAKTLTDKEVEKEVQQLVSWIESSLDATLRS